MTPDLAGQFLLLSTHKPQTAPQIMAEVSSRSSRKRYALIGTGGRAIFFYTALVRDYGATSELVAFADTNQTRMNYANSKIKELGHDAVPTYKAHDFDVMIKETSPDEIIVTTPDRTHNTYVGRAFPFNSKALYIVADNCRTRLFERSSLAAMLSQKSP